MIQRYAQRRIKFTVTLLAVCGMSQFALAQTADPDPNPTPTYTFDISKPPLYKDFKGAILDLPDAALRQGVGTTTWRTHHEESKTGFPEWIQNTATFTLTRTRHWVIYQNPKHNGSDTTTKVSTVRGYSKTQAHSMTSALEVSAGASFFGLSVNAKKRSQHKRQFDGNLDGGNNPRSG
jgi:hypothetical protein